MSTATVRCILRIVAIVTILVGWIGMSMGLIGLWSISSLMRESNMDFQSSVHGAGIDFHSSISGLGAYAILSWLVVATSGLILYVASAAIARRVTQEPGEAASKRDVLHRRLAQE